VSQQLAPINQPGSFDLMLRQADILAQSRIIPAAYRNRSADVVAAGLAGQAFGWDVMTSLRNYHVIEGTASLGAWYRTLGEAKEFIVERPELA